MSTVKLIRFYVCCNLNFVLRFEFPTDMRSVEFTAEVACLIDAIVMNHGKATVINKMSHVTCKQTTSKTLVKDLEK